MTTIYITEQEIKEKITNCDKRIASLHRKEEKKGLDRFERIALSGAKTEKLILTSILNPNTNKEIFKLLLAKFDELCNTSYDVVGEFVREGKWGEGKYIEYCKVSIDYRNKYVRKLCSIGYGKLL